MSIKTADRWSKILFLFGCAVFLTLTTADVNTEAVDHQASLPFGPHGDVVVFTVLITMGATFVQVAIWRMRHQARQQQRFVDDVKTMLHEQYGNGYADGLAKRPPALHVVPTEIDLPSQQPPKTIEGSGIKWI